MNELRFEFGTTSSALSSSADELVSVSWFHMSEAVPHNASSSSSLCSVCPMVGSLEWGDSC